MTDQKALLLELGDIFPSIGMVVPFIELKFRLGAKYGQDLLEETLEALIEKGIMTKFEFNNSINYKSKDDIPITMGKAKTSEGGSEQLTELSNLVLAIAKHLGDETITQLANKYKTNNNL